MLISAMGYLILGAFSFLVVILFLAALVRSQAKRGTLPSDLPPVREKPSADEPTPGDSTTADKTQARKADKHTPPA